jgi:hypothetical protein
MYPSICPLANAGLTPFFWYCTLPGITFNPSTAPIYPITPGFGESPAPDTFEHLHPAPPHPSEREAKDDICEEQFIEQNTVENKNEEISMLSQLPSMSQDTFTAVIKQIEMETPEIVKALSSLGLAVGTAREIAFRITKAAQTPTSK